MKAIPFLFFFLPIFCFLSEQQVFPSTTPKSSGGSTLTHSLETRVTTALVKKDFPLALQRYDELFSITFKENTGLLKKICLKIFETLLTSQHDPIKREVLRSLHTVLNPTLGRLLFSVLGDPNQKVREQAISILSHYNHELLYPDISSSLLSDNPRVVESALEIIHANKQKLFLDQITPLLKHEDIFVKARAIRVLGILEPSESIQKKLKTLLSHPSGRIRSAVVESYRNLDTEGSKIQSVLQDDDKDVRKALLLWASDNPSPLADQIIRKELSSKDRQLFSEACKASLHSVLLVDQIQWRRLLTVESKTLRKTALKALIRKDGFLDEETFNLFLNDASSEIQEEAAKALLNSTDFLAKGMLNEILDSGSIRAQLALVHHLVSSSNPISKNPSEQNREDSGSLLDDKNLLDLLQKDHAELQSQAMLLMERLPLDQQKKLAQKILLSNKVTVRSAFFSYLSRKNKRKLYLLNYKEGLDDPSIDVQAQALSGAFMLPKNDRIPMLEKKMTSPFWKIRRSCQLAAQFLPSDPEKENLILKGKTDPHAKVREGALKAAITLKDPKRTLSILSKALFDENELVRALALKKLQAPKKSSIKDTEEGLENTPKKETEKENPKSPKKPSPSPAPSSSTDKLHKWLKGSKKKTFFKKIS